jgi:transketolase
VVSLSCLEWFADQDDCYQQEVLAGDTGERVSLEHFAESADHQTWYEEFGITADHVVAAAKASLARARAR